MRGLSVEERARLFLEKLREGLFHYVRVVTESAEEEGCLLEVAGEVEGEGVVVDWLKLEKNGRVIYLFEVPMVFEIGQPCLKEGP